MDAAKTKNANSFSQAAKEDWFLSSRPLRPRHTLSIKLNNGKTYKYLASCRAKPGDQALIDFGGASSYQMGNVESIEKGAAVKGNHALLPLFTFSTTPEKADIKENIEGVKDYESVEEARWYFDLETFEGATEHFRVVDVLVQSVLNAVSVIAHPELATKDQINEAKAFLAKERPIPAIMFSKEFCNHYFNNRNNIYFLLAKCSETAFTGFYPGWKDDLKKCAFLNDPKLEELGVRVDYSGGKGEHDYVVYLYYAIEGSDELADYFSGNAEFKAFTNELVFRSALSILIRGGLVNLLKAALSVEMPIRSFYDKLIAFADEIGSTECAKLLKSVDYRSTVPAQADAPKPAADDRFKIRDGVLLEYKGNDETVSIPDNVKVIGDYVFKGNENIKKVIVPDSVTQIKKMAFYYCVELREVVLGKNISSIGAECFCECKSLTSINLDNTKMKTLNNDCFKYCSSLKSIDLGKSKITAIKKYAFYDSGLEEIILPSKLESIDEAAFAKTKVKELVIPATVKVISFDAFLFGYSGVSELKRIVFEGTEPLKFWVHKVGYDCVLACKRGSALMAMLEEQNARLADEHAKRPYDSNAPRKLEGI